MLAVIALGNPGRAYRTTRHNLGYMVADRLAAAHGVRFRRRYKSYYTTLTEAGRDIVLAKPRTYMNDSGRAVTAVTYAFEVDIADLIVVCDDINLPLAKIQYIYQLVRRTSSMETPIGEDDDQELMDLIPDEKAVLPSEQIEEERRVALIFNWLDELLDNEKDIIILRFGLDDGEPKTLESIGQRYGVTRERIRQIEASALRKLRKMTMRMDIGLDEIL